MKARRDSLAKATAMHADFWHRERISQLRAEGAMLRRALRERGVDPKTVLNFVPRKTGK